MTGSGRMRSYKLVPGAAPAGPVTAEQLWDAYACFLDAVLPVAEEVGLRLAGRDEGEPDAA